MVQDREYPEHFRLRIARMLAVRPTVKLYIITTGELWPVKIGVSQAPEERLKQLQTSHWLTLQLYRLFLFPEAKAYQFERAAHKAFSKDSLSGEWFGLKASAAEAKLLELFSEEGYFRDAAGEMEKL